MPYDKAVEPDEYMAKKSYSKKGDEIVQLNYKAIDQAKTVWLNRSEAGMG